MHLLYFASLVVIFFKSIARAQDPLCESGEYLIDRVCCPMCDSGNRVLRPCTETTSGATSCIPCMLGTYMDHPSGLTECFKCKSCDSGSGLRMKSGCTYTRNTVCSCMEGYYCNNPATEDCDLCERHTVCGAGQKVKVPGTERSNTICEKCPTGTFSNRSMSNSCLTWRSCRDLGMKEEAPGTDKEDVRCGEPNRSRLGLITAVVHAVVQTVVIITVCRKERMPKVEKTATENEAPNQRKVPVQETQQPDTEACMPPQCTTTCSGEQVEIQQCRRSSLNIEVI